MTNHPGRATAPGPFASLAEQTETLRALRAQAGITQQSAAILAAAGDQTWRQWERGERRMPAAAMELWCMALAIGGPAPYIAPGDWMARWVRPPFVRAAERAAAAA